MPQTTRRLCCYLYISSFGRIKFQHESAVTKKVSYSELVNFGQLLISSCEFILNFDFLDVAR